MNSINEEYSDARIKKIGYVAICGVLKEVLNTGLRIAAMNELRCIKMLIDPSYPDRDVDLALLRILDEPHVKLASELADFTFHEVIELYAVLTSLNDKAVLKDKWAAEMGWKLVWQFQFFRRHHRRRDRYVNFTRVLKTSQRLIYEFLKLMLTGEIRMLNHAYRSNYSPGRLKALVSNHNDSITTLLVDLIEKLKDAEQRSIALMV
jgi:hypothetical protein